MTPYDHRCRPLAALSLALLLALLSACQQPASVSLATGPSSSSTGVNTAQARQYLQLVSQLAHPAMEGRGPGTRGIERARDLLVEHFRNLGLAPVVASDVQPGPQVAYTQSFNIELSVAARTQQLTLHAGDAVVQLKPSRDFNTLGFSSDGTFSGEPVFVGYGIVNPDENYDSFAAADAKPDLLKGKVAIAFRYEPMDDDGLSRWVNRSHAAGDPHAGTHRKASEVGGVWSNSASLLSKARWAAQRGAVALLVVNPPARADGGLRSTRSTGAEAASPIPVLHITPDAFRTILERAGRHADAAVRAYQKRSDAGQLQPDPLRGVTLAGQVDLERPAARIDNVVALLPGAGRLADQVIVVGAHYDHLGYGDLGSLHAGSEPVIHPGADDNASGTAALMILAQRLTQLQNSMPANDQRAVLFAAFSGEERGLLGSLHMVRHFAQLGLKREQVVAMLNMDMVGRVKDGKLYVIGGGTSPQWEPIVANARLGIPLDVQLHTRATGGSDHMSFLLQQIPALMFFTGVHSDYHRPSDTADKINVADAMRVIDVIERVLLQLRTLPEPPPFVNDPQALRLAGLGPAGSGLAAYLGVMPSYATLDAPGCVLTGVVPHSPAQAAGLRSGDVLIRWDDQPVPDVQALSRLLQQAQPGQVVQLTILRDGQPLTIPVTLGRRN